MERFCWDFWLLAAMSNQVLDHLQIEKLNCLAGFTHLGVSALAWRPSDVKVEVDGQKQNKSEFKSEDARS